LRVLEKALSPLINSASELPGLGIGQGEKWVRQTLLNNKSFCEPYKGRWQLGHAIVATATRE